MAMNIVKTEDRDIFSVEPEGDNDMPTRSASIRLDSPSLSLRPNNDVGKRPASKDGNQILLELSMPTPVSQSHTDDEDNSSSTTITAAAATMSFQQDSIARLAIPSSELVSSMNKLRELGISSTIPLPEFVVVGDQSAGKSSIVEALCNVSLPRDAGTCTRCPFMITTSARDTAWTCEVTLHHRYVYRPHGHNTPFERWQEQPPVTEKVDTIHSKALLGDVLRRAQSKLLTQDGVRVLFSPNVICLKITGPGLPELSFYDLPGSINVVENEEDQHLVKFVETLVRDYISCDKALIMLACAGDQDVENSTSFRFVRECKAQDRCLGVFTKADLMSPPRLQYASRLLNREVFPLGKGWFITKQPAQSELNEGITQQQALEREKSFFEAGVWNTTYARFATRYGIPNLQAVIAEELRQHILNNIGEIVNRVQCRMDEINTALQQYRAKDPHPMATVIDVLSAVNASLKKHLDCCSDKVDFRSRINKLKEQFRTRLLAMAPDLDPTTPDYKAKKSRESTVTPRNADVIMLDSDDDDDGESTAVTTPTPRSAHKRRAVGELLTPTSNKRVKTEAAPPLSTSRPISAPTLKRVIFTIPGIEATNDKYSTSAIPGQEDPNVHKVIILQSIAGWDHVCDQALGALDKHLETMLKAVLQQELIAYSGCELHKQTHEHAHRLASQILHEHLDEIKDRLARERYHPGTVTDISVHKAAVSDELFKKRNTKRLQEFFDKHEADTGKALSAAEKSKRLADDAITRPSSNDPHASAVKLLVLPLAYYRVAADRFADEFAMSLEYKVVRQLKERMLPALRQELRTADLQACEQLLIEDAGREQERQSLVHELGRLERAMNELTELPNGHD